MRKIVGLLCILLTTTVFEGHVSAQEEELAGFWHSIGYGLWLDVSAAHVEVYQATDTTCVRMLEVGNVVYEGQSATLENTMLTGLGRFIGADTYTLTMTDSLLNLNVGKLNPIQAERAEAIPDVCTEPTTNTPEHTFETFWHMFNEHYAFFDLHHVDWQAAYTEYRPQVTSETSEAELFTILQEMVTPLNDGHVSINTLFNSFSAVRMPEWFDGADDAAFDTFAMIPATHYLIDEPQYAANDRIIYGHLSETVGYMSILAFDEMSEDGDDIASLRTGMTDIMASFMGVDSIVIDVRYNTGGDDTNGLYVAGNFTNESVPVFSKSVWADQAFHPLLDVSVEPVTDTPFTGAVYVLTSGLSVSAAETFTLAMHALPNVTLVGEATNGILSDLWFVMLPNGWLATLSNELYLAPDGTLYEGRGIPPDHEIPMTLDALNAKTDPVIEGILTLVSSS